MLSNSQKQVPKVEQHAEVELVLCHQSEVPYHSSISSALSNRKLVFQTNKAAYCAVCRAKGQKAKKEPHKRQKIILNRTRRLTTFPFAMFKNGDFCCACQHNVHSNHFPSKNVTRFRLNKAQVKVVPILCEILHKWEHVSVILCTAPKKLKTACRQKL